MLEEDEELGRTDSTDDGLQSLLDNVEDFLESNSGGDPTKSSSVAKDDGQREEIESAAPGNDKSINNFTPRSKNRKSIQESLEAMDAPTELRQATALLLQSTLLDEDTAWLLTSDILDLPIEDAGGDGSLDNENINEGGGGEGHIDDEQIEGDGEESKQTLEEDDVAGEDQNVTETLTAGNNDALTSSAAADTTTAEGENTQEPSESTSLLASSSKEIDDMLRPSIFTMHSMPPDEK